MLFYIDRTVGERMAEGALTAQERDFFRDLSIFCQRGECVLCGELESLRALRDDGGIESRSAYYAACGQHAEQRSYMEAVETVFVLTCSDGRRRDILPPFLWLKYFFIPLSKAVSWTRLGGECVLLGENLRDSRFYTLIGKNYCRRKGIRGLSIRFRRDHGGGSTTAEVLEELVGTERAPTLCIVDSDRKYGPTAACPDGPAPGETYESVVKQRRRQRDLEPCFPFDVVLLSVHEAENLIPLSVLDGMSAAHPDLRPLAMALRRLLRIDNGEPILYYDLKCGQPDSAGPRWEYWDGIRRRLNLAEGPGTLPVSYPSAGVDKLLKRAADYIENADADVEPEEYLLPLWDRLGAKLLSWGCARPPLLLGGGRIPGGAE